MNMHELFYRPSIVKRHGRVKEKNGNAATIKRQSAVVQNLFLRFFC
jgi:hypothetical protein